MTSSKHEQRPIEKLKCAWATIASTKSGVKLAAQFIKSAILFGPHKYKAIRQHLNVFIAARYAYSLKRGERSDREEM